MTLELVLEDTWKAARQERIGAEEALQAEGTSHQDMETENSGQVQDMVKFCH